MKKTLRGIGTAGLNLLALVLWITALFCAAAWKSARIWAPIVGVLMVVASLWVIEYPLAGLALGLLLAEHVFVGLSYAYGTRAARVIVDQPSAFRGSWRRHSYPFLGIRLLRLELVGLLFVALVAGVVWKGLGWESLVEYRWPLLVAAHTIFWVSEIRALLRDPREVAEEERRQATAATERARPYREAVATHASLLTDAERRREQADDAAARGWEARRVEALVRAAEEAETAEARAYADLQALHAKGQAALRMEEAALLLAEQAEARAQGVSNRFGMVSRGVTILALYSVLVWLLMGIEVLLFGENWMAILITGAILLVNAVLDPLERRSGQVVGAVLSLLADYLVAIFVWLIGWFVWDWEGLGDWMSEWGGAILLTYGVIQVISTWYPHWVPAMWRRRVRIALMIALPLTAVAWAIIAWLWP